MIESEGHNRPYGIKLLEIHSDAQGTHAPTNTARNAHFVSKKVNLLQMNEEEFADYSTYIQLTSPDFTLRSDLSFEISNILNGYNTGFSHWSKGTVGSLRNVGAETVARFKRCRDKASKSLKEGEMSPGNKPNLIMRDKTLNRSGSFPVKFDLQGAKTALRSITRGQQTRDSNPTSTRTTRSKDPKVGRAHSGTDSGSTDGNVSGHPDGDSQDRVTTALSAGQRAKIKDFIIELEDGDENITRYFKGLPEVTQAAIAFHDNPIDSLKDYIQGQINKEDPDGDGQGDGNTT